MRLCATDVTVERRRAKDSCRIRAEKIRPMCDNIIAKIRIMCDNTLYCVVLALFVCKSQMQYNKVHSANFQVKLCGPMFALFTGQVSVPQGRLGVGLSAQIQVCTVLCCIEYYICT